LQVIARADVVLCCVGVVLLWNRHVEQVGVLPFGINQCWTREFLKWGICRPESPNKSAQGDLKWRSTRNAAFTGYAVMDFRALKFRCS
jgi:hypothetical protein